MNSKSLLVILGVFLIILFNSIIYGALNTDMFIDGDVYVRVDRNIRVTGIKVIEQTGGAYEIYNCDYSKDTTSIQVTLPSSDSSIVYEITIVNKENVDYIVSGITEESYSNNNIKYEIFDLEKGTIIEGETTYTFKIKLTTNENDSKNNVILSLKYTFEEWISNLYNRVAYEVKSLDTNLDFGVAPTKETSGAYEMYSTKDDEYPVYYYRGIVENNNVNFAGFCWKMVRTTSTGGVKLIYNGVPASDGSCNNTGASSQISAAKFNATINSASDAGYMYGMTYNFTHAGYSGGNHTYGNDVRWDGTNYTLVDTITISSWRQNRYDVGAKYHYTCFSNSSTCAVVYYLNYVGFSDIVDYLTLTGGKNIEDVKNEMFSNINDSEAKKKVDEWYSANMLEYTNMMEDTVWCNDRSLYAGLLKGKDAPAPNGNLTNIFGAAGRFELSDSYNPIVECPNKNDSFTIDSKNGNGALKYPVGLLTKDEVVLSGVRAKEYSKNNYLYTGENWWTMSPYMDFYLHLFNVSEQGKDYANSVAGIRPAVSVKNSVMISEGNGSVSKPYKLVETK